QALRGRNRFDKSSRLQAAARSLTTGEMNVASTAGATPRESTMQLPDRSRVLIRLPLLIPLAIAAVTLFTMATGARQPAQRPAAELEVEMVSRLQRLSAAVLARNPGAIAALLDDSFTDENGRDKYGAITALTAAGSTPPLGYRPDREVYTIAPGQRALTAKNTVRIF